jgi:antitoxin MazE
MKTSIVQIGNSKGVRIPKAFLEQLKFGEAVEFEILPEGLLLRPVVEPEEPAVARAGWKEMFRSALSEEGDDGSDFADWNTPGLSGFDEKEW